MDFWDRSRLVRRVMRYRRAPAEGTASPVEGKCPSLQHGGFPKIRDILLGVPV